jgi:CheY-like chemotaxis protein
MLSEWRVQPAEAGSGDEALAALQQAQELRRPFAFVILDADAAGGVDAFALAKEIKWHSSLALATILLVDTNEFRNDVKREEFGIAEFCVKPVSRPALRTALLTIVDREFRHSAVAVAAKYAPHGNGATEQLRILLVELNRINRRMTQRMLEKRGHQVSTACDGLEALRILETEPFDVVLLQVQMPGMDGFEVTARIRRNEEKTGAHQPIIAMTAHAMAGDRERCLAAGMDGYLAKPVRHADLTEALNKVRAALAQAETRHPPAVGPYTVGYGLA